MRFFKLFERGRWRVHAFEDGPEADAFIPKGALSISETEANELSRIPPSEEDKRAMADGIAALGGRGIGVTRFPTKDFKEAIGHICVNSAHIEVTLRTVIWQAAGITSEVGMAFTGGVNSIDQLLLTLEQLLELRHPHLIGAFKPVAARLRALNASRGRFVHSLWHPGKEGAAMISKYFLTRSHDDSRTASVTLDDLYQVAEGFSAVESDLLGAVLNPMIQGGG